MTIDDHHSPAPTARFRDQLKRPELAIAMLILVAFLVLASLQIITRYVFGQQFVWTEELSAVLLIWLTFLGAAAIERDNGHVRLHTLDELLPGRVTRWIYAVYDVAILFWLGCLIYGGYALLGQLNFEMTPALKIPYRYVMIVVPIAAALMALYVLRNFLTNIGVLGRRDGC